jgi:hypothetical protein
VIRAGKLQETGQGSKKASKDVREMDEFEKVED